MKHKKVAKKMHKRTASSKENGKKKISVKKSRRDGKGKEAPITKVKVIGIGGAGNNAVSRMYSVFPRGVDLIVVNTDAQDLNYAQAKKKIQIGKTITRGLGAGMDPDVGSRAAEENQEDIVNALQGADIAFITAGFGGGTGTGAAPIVAQIAKNLGILTVAVVTKPFSFEGARRAQIAEDGLLRLKDSVDLLITIPNDRVFSVISPDTPLTRAFQEIDEILKNSVLGMTEILSSPGIINVDFADVRTIVENAGAGVIGMGKASGQDRSVKAANIAANSPLLETSIYGARGLLLVISGQRDLKMSEVNDIAKTISENLDQAAKIIVGAYHDRGLRKGEIKITLVATGFNEGFNKKPPFVPSLFSAQDGEGGKKVREKGKEARKEKLVKEAKLIEERESSHATKDEEKEKSEDEWDIPAFLRRKGQKR